MPDTRSSTIALLKAENEKLKLEIQELKKMNSSEYKINITPEWTWSSSTQPAKIRISKNLIKFINGINDKQIENGEGRIRDIEGDICNLKVKY